MTTIVKMQFGGLGLREGGRWRWSPEHGEYRVRGRWGAKGGYGRLGDLLLNVMGGRGG